MQRQRGAGGRAGGDDHAEAQRGTDEAQRGAFDQQQGGDVARPGADGTQDGEFAPAFAEAGEEQSEFDVILEAAGDKKIGVIKVVREIVSGLGLKEAKDLVDGAPKPLLEKATKEAAADAKAKLEAAGASVSVK